MFRDPSKPKADLAVTLSRDGAEQLMHALESALDLLHARRAEWTATPEGQSWLEHRGQRAA